jgi:hypothetical protein
MPPAAALRAAQNSLRQNPNWSAPKYWAAFTLQGEYRKVISRPNAARRPYVWMILMGGVALIVVGGWYAIYRGRRRAQT